MKKKKIVAGVAVGAAVAGLTLGGVLMHDMTHPSLYGPPPDYSERQSESESVSAFLRESEEASAAAASAEETESETEFDPSEMEIQDVYGPPVYFEDAD